MRKLVTKRVVAEIAPIKGADRIERITIDGWHCVAKKGEFTVGDECIYFEIDSFLPASDSRFSFLMQHTRVYNGQEGHRLRTVKLRKQVSQGLAMPVACFPELASASEEDFAKILNVVKYEPPIPACIAGEVEGVFPSFIPKTDEERAQNMIDEIFVENKDARYEVTLKLDGTSMTVFSYDGNVGVCSRNYQLKVNDANANNTMVKLATESGLLDRLRGIKRNVAIQGELMGEGIQKNREKLKGHWLFVFNIYDIDEKRFLTPLERMEFFRVHLAELPHILKVPCVHFDEGVHDFLGGSITNIDDLIAVADGPSLCADVREGLVWKRMDGKFSFKTISNQFLVKGGD